ncbi:beta-lactamase/transpeptidase-like protein [Abortiporus biennis]|nr:beta-lactamase/transpeptidase-like protein [Abortiporus biennis]
MFRLSYILLPVLLRTTSAFAREHGQGITPQISELAESLLESSQTPGLSVGVVHLQNGSVSLEFGSWGNRTEEGDKVTPDTLFAIGSTSKAFLTTSVGILMDDYANGRNVTSLPPGLTAFNWQTKVKDVLPGEWKLIDSFATEKANFQDIFSHVSGLPRHDMSYSSGDTLQTAVNRLKLLKPTREFRQEMQYDNLMYAIGAYVVTKYTGKTFPEFVKARIFDPLNMTSTSYSGTQAAASGHMSDAFTSVYDPGARNGGPARKIPFLFTDEDQATIVAGPGGILSSAVDMAKWLAVILNGGVDPISQNRIIPETVFNETTTAHVIVPDDPGVSTTSIPIRGYGLGWFRTSLSGLEVVEHDGGIPGWLALHTVLPNEGLAVISYINNGVSFINEPITEAIIGNVLNPQTPSSSSPATAPPPSTPTTSSSSTASSATYISKRFDSRLAGMKSRSLTRDFTKAPSPPLPIERYAGTYSDAAYGNFTLCTTSSPSVLCKAVIANFTAVYKDDISPTCSLYAYWPRIWSSHFKLTCLDGYKQNLTNTDPPPESASGTNKHSFVIRVVTLYPEGFGQNTTSFALSRVSPDIQIAFDVDDSVSSHGGSSGAEVRGLAFPHGFESGEETLPDSELKNSLVYFTRTGSSN